MLDCVDTKGPDLVYAEVGFIAPEPPNVTEDQPYAINEDYSTSDYYRFARVLMPLPHMDDIDQV